MYYFASKLLAPFLHLTNVLIFAFILIILFGKFFPKKYIKFFRSLIIFLFLTIGFFPIGTLGLKYLEKKHIDQQQFFNIDNIIVLAGSENIEATKITNKVNLNAGSERLIASVKLAIENKNAKIFFLGGDGNLIKTSINEAIVSSKFYKDVGFDLNRVNFIDNTRNTYENLKEFKKFTQKDKKNILITSAFHMERSLLIAEKLNIKLVPYAVDYRGINDHSIINFYQGFSISNNLGSFDIFFREMLGILAVKLFY